MRLHFFHMPDVVHTNQIPDGKRRLEIDWEE